MDCGSQDRPVSGALPFSRDDEDDGAGLAAAPSVDEVADDEFGLIYGQAVEIDAAGERRIREIVARVEAGVFGAAFGHGRETYLSDSYPWSVPTLKGGPDTALPLWVTEEPDGFLSAIEIMRADGMREVVRVQRVGRPAH